MDQQMDEAVNYYITVSRREQLCDFCILSWDCQKMEECHEGEMPELPCKDLDETWVERHIDKEAIAEYLERFGESVESY